MRDKRVNSRCMESPEKGSNLLRMFMFFFVCLFECWGCWSWSSAPAKYNHSWFSLPAKSMLAFVRKSLKLKICIISTSLSLLTSRKSLILWICESDLSLESMGSTLPWKFYTDLQRKQRCPKEYMKSMDLVGLRY